MLYAEVQDVEAGFRALSKEEQTRCVALLSEAAVIIDHYNPDADADTKRVVSCRMVRRQLGEDGRRQLSHGFHPGHRHRPGLQPELDHGQRILRRTVSFQAGKETAGRREQDRSPQPAGGLMLKGIDITLYTKTQTGEDRFHAPIYEETPVTVHNVLVGEPSSEAVVTELQLTGRRIAYTLALPKGDAHDWNNVRVAFWGQTFRTVGGAVQGIGSMVPLAWNKKVQVVRDE